MIASSKEGIALNDIIRDLKKFTSKKIASEIISGNESRKEWMLNIFHFRGNCHPKNINYKFWKDNFDCYELFTPKMFDQKMDYIHNNPVRAELVELPHEYLFSSARNYAGMPGLLDVIVV
jgi:hypothetical protein